MLLLLCACGSANEAPKISAKPDAAVSRYDDLPRLEGAEVAGRYPLYKGEERLAKDIVCIGNRPYIYADYSEALEGLSRPLFEDASGVYMSLADFVLMNDCCVEFVPEDESVHYYHLQSHPWADEAAAYIAAADANPNTKAAYIRLEDIMADFGLNGRFTNFNLMRLRVFTDYLSDFSRAFYIAWIPVYVNPEEGIRNNIAADFCFYNADFVFTLDYMQLKGGKIGLHGYTHQFGDSISADGVEFGGRGNRGAEELFTLFDNAASVCHSLGYEYYFFEFPHYDATKFEKDTAEKYFDMIYEYYMSKKEGVIERHQIGNRICLWVPTPADYVYNASDLSGILARLESSRKSGQILSLFIHPFVDVDRFGCNTEGDTRSFNYYEPTGVLHGLVQYLGEHSYIFDEIK